MRFHRAAGLLATTVAAPRCRCRSGRRAASGPRYFTPPTPYHDVGRFDPGCEGLDLRVAYDYEGVYSEQIVPGTNRQAFLFKDDFTFSERWVDRATGKVVLRIHGAYVAAGDLGHQGAARSGARRGRAARGPRGAGLRVRVPGGRLATWSGPVTEPSCTAPGAPCG